MIMEKQVLGCIIFDVITCVGLDKAVLLITYKKWDSSTKHARFAHLPYHPIIIVKLKAMF